MPLMEYLSGTASQHQKVTIFDKVMGNAAALLSVKAGCGEVWSPLGSELAIETFKKYGIVHHLNATVPYIAQADGKNMCPMEKLSIDKEPEEFYRIMEERTTANTTTDSC